MRVLVACEESQRVCQAFRDKGHEAYSCDIIEPSGGHPEWHIKGDCIPLLNGDCDFKTQDGQMHHIDGKWDMIIAFPPCTHLAVSGAAWFEKKRKDGRQRDGIEFFVKFLYAECEKIVVENPIGIISGGYIPKWFPDLAGKYALPKKPSQIIQPWMFGDNYSKSTCLWEKGVPPLVPLISEQPELECFEWVDKKTGKRKRQPKWVADAWRLAPSERARVRSKTFPGIAKAMAEQWGTIAADRKDENCSEKPNNCEHITEDGVTCARYPACDDCPDNPLNKVKGSERLVKGSEVTTDCRRL